jgi:N-acetylglucosaminyldiphosphoundecaprenol N-acetyl-beta-D-mannosaminyltransferase
MPVEQGKSGAIVLGTYIDALTWDQCLNRIVLWAARRESRSVFLCNVHSVVTGMCTPDFGRVLQQADLALPDGAPIAWWLRRCGHKGQPRINGPDLMLRCCARAAEAGLAVFLYGCSEATLDQLGARLREAFPSLKLAGVWAPPFRALTPEEDARVTGIIQASGAQIVFVAMGCPKQEAWIAQHRERIPAVMIGVGAAFDYHAGLIRRAPRWMQRAGLEWLYRLVCEPGRLWRRYLVTNTLFVAFLLGELMAKRRSGSTCNCGQRTHGRSS